MMRRAFSQLRNGRRGPVMLETPMDVGNEEIDEALRGWNATMDADGRVVAGVGSAEQ